MITYAKIQALSGSNIQFEQDLPADIQWMPAGEHEIVASKDGKPTKLVVNVTADIVEALNKSLEEIKAQGFDAYFDFNHDDEGASGWVKAFFWGGDDPVTGGIRAKVEWSEEGAQAIRGKSYKRFSPSFLTDKSGKVIGTTPNAGGLVNRPAFRGIAAVMAAKEISDTDLRFVSASEMPDEARNKNENKAMTEEEVKKMQKLEAENEELKKTVEGLQAKVKAQDEEAEKMKADAKEREINDLVNTAVTAGKITAKDEKQIGALKRVAAADMDSAKALIDSMQVLAKAQGLTQAITPKTTGGESAVNANDRQFSVVREIQAKNPGMSGEDAFRLAKESNPDLFK